MLERKGAPAKPSPFGTGAGHLAAVTGEAMKYKIMALKQIGRVLVDDDQKSAEAEAGALLKCLEHDPNQRTPPASTSRSA